MVIVETVETKKQMDEAFAVRYAVFVEEQNVPAEEEIDEFEEESVHFVAYENNIPIGAGRMRKGTDFIKVERICVLPPYRKTGAGRYIMKAIEALGQEQNFAEAKLHAQTRAVPFYEKLGYTITSDIFIDAGIPHVAMVKSL